jgi:hypothetical protein
MPSNQTFFGEITTRFHRSQRNRSEFATYLYNHFGEPNTRLKKDSAFWFEPTRRAKFTGFSSYRDFSDDFTSLLLKPLIFAVLGAYEALKRVICIPAALGQVVNLNLPGFFHKVIDFCETLLFAAICETWAAIELVLQMGSLEAETNDLGNNHNPSDVSLFSDGSSSSNTRMSYERAEEEESETEDFDATSRATLLQNAFL